MKDYSIPMNEGAAVPDAAKALADVFRFGRQKHMSGGTQSFANGGAVDDMNDPAMSAAGPVDWGAYLQGADAASPDEWQQAAAGVPPQEDPQEMTRQIIMSGETEDDRWRRLQYARRGFDQARAHAAAAADAGDFQNAAQSANLAFNYYPGAESIRFAPADTGQGLIAQIGDQGVPVSAQQLRQVQFDQAFHKGVAPMLAQQAQAPQARPAQRQAAPQGERPIESTYAAEAKELGIDPKTVAMSHRIFPTVGMNQQRLQWLSAQQGQEANRQSLERRAETAAGSKVGAAQITAQGHENVAATKAQGGASREEIRGKWQLALQGSKNTTSLQALAAKNAAAAQNAQMKGAWATVARAASTPGIDMQQVVNDLRTQNIDLPALLAATHGAPPSAPGGGTAPATAPGQPQRPAQVKGTDGNTYYQWPDGKYRAKPPQ